MPKITKDDMVNDIDVKKPALKQVSKEKEETKTINVYGIPAAWVDLIKHRGFSFAAFTRIAIEEKMKKEGLL